MIADKKKKGGQRENKKYSKKWEDKRIRGFLFSMVLMGRYSLLEELGYRA